MSNLVIKANDLAYATNFSKILFRNVNFEYFGGDIICLLGNNGSGKSSLLKVCAGLLEATYGKLHIQYTHKIYSNHYTENNIMSWLPQQLGRPADFNVIEFLNLSGIFINKNKVLYNKNLIDYSSILRDFEVSHLEKRELIELSGGEWKRVQLARIWAKKARILFLDEPESDLDISHKLGLIERCKLYALQNNSIIFIATHDLLFAKEVANKICALSDALWVWNSEADVFWGANIIQKLFGVRKLLG
jgi:ABC-type cobalamin/Fe3+-siderophores transport system ATPase subunit